MSVPAGIVALLAVAGISGAAAASVAVTSSASISEQVANAAHAVTPDWVTVTAAKRRLPAMGPATSPSAAAVDAPPLAPPSRDAAQARRSAGLTGRGAHDHGIRSDQQRARQRLHSDDDGGELQVNIDARPPSLAPSPTGRRPRSRAISPAAETCTRSSVQVTSALPPQQEHPEDNGVPGRQSDNAPGPRTRQHPAFNERSHARSARRTTLRTAR